MELENNLIPLNQGKLKYRVLACCVGRLIDDDQINWASFSGG